MYSSSGRKALVVGIANEHSIAWEMSPHTLDLHQRFRRIPGLPPATEDVGDDPLREPPAGKPAPSRRGRRVAGPSAEDKAEQVG